jgi:hypothetical protein
VTGQACHGTGHPPIPSAEGAHSPASRAMTSISNSQRLSAKRSTSRSLARAHSSGGSSVFMASIVFFLAAAETATDRKTTFHLVP